MNWRVKGATNINTYAFVPASVVVDVNNAACAGIQASLDKGIVLGEVVLIDIGVENIVRQELPSDGETEDVESVVIDEVLHLTFTVVTIVLKQRWPCCASRAASVGVAAEIESGDVDTGETELACAGGCGGTTRRGSGRTGRRCGGCARSWRACWRDSRSRSWDALEVIWFDGSVHV